MTFDLFIARTFAVLAALLVCVLILLVTAVALEIWKDIRR
jgi:hypothetical protein